MSETVLENLWSVSQALFGSSKLVGHLGDIAAAEILEFPSLEQIPDALLWIQFRGIARQAFQMEPFGGLALQKVLDHLRTMDRRPIPDDEQVA